MHSYLPKVLHPYLPIMKHSYLPVTSGLIDTDLKFHAIDHDKISSDVEEGFVRWKERLNCLLM